MVYPISDSKTEIIIRRHIEGIQKLLNPQHGDTTTPSTTPEEEAAGVAVIMLNPATQNHFELQIKTLQDAPRDPDKLGELLKMKQRQYEEATDSEDIERLVPEILMYKFVLFLVCRKKSTSLLERYGEECYSRYWGSSYKNVLYRDNT